MHKGFTLVEILVVIILLPFIFLLLDGLFVTLLGGIPKSYTIAQENITLQNMLEQMQQDVDRARGLPESFADGKKVNEKQFFIELPESTICYQQKDGQIIRSTLTGNEQGYISDERTWHLPHTKLQWHVWKKNGRGYAVEVKTHIEYKTQGRWKKTMANSHLYFGGVSR